jgi:membrane protease YdiL (CAAX protease family)
MLRLGAIYIAVSFWVLPLYLRCKTPHVWIVCVGLGERPPMRIAPLLLLGFILGTAAVFCGSLAQQSMSVRLHGLTPLGAVMLGGSVTEEIIMRGYLYPAFRTRYSVWGAIAATLVIVALTHWTNFRISQVAILFIPPTQVIMCLLREHYGNTYPSLFFHVGYNCAFAFMA